MGSPREFGGYLPIELPAKNPVYGAGGFYSAACLNSGRAGIFVSLEHLGAERLWCPEYYCPSVKRYLEARSVAVISYQIGDDLLPLWDFAPRSSDAVLLVNYFGMLGSRLKEHVDSFRKVVFDNCMAFFEPPVMRSGVLNVYSCRKFFGVSDGAYIVGNELPDVSLLELDESFGRSAHLLESLERGTDSAYGLSVANERSLDCDAKRMSILTSALMSACSYDESARARRRNFALLDSLFEAEQQLSFEISDGAVPSYYPLLLSKDIRGKLVERSIYVPTLWREYIETDARSESRESLLSRKLCCLPIDQRYGADDMRKLASIVRQVIEEDR